MRKLEELINSILSFCDKNILANIILQLFIIVGLVMLASLVLTVVVPVLFIVVLLIGKYCVPISVAIYMALENLLNL